MASRFKSFLTALAAALLFAVPACAYERIVSLYSGHTDNIIALGGQSRLVGLSKNDEPARLPDLPRFAPKTGAEAILAVRPDLVLIRSMIEKQNPSLKDVLERAGVTVLSIDPPAWENFTAYLRTLAPLIEVDPQKAVLQFVDLCDEIREQAAIAWRMNRPAPSIFIEATAKELHTCAPKSWAAHMIELAGGSNAAKSAEPLRQGSAIAPWGLERVMGLLSQHLDVYLVQHGPMNRSTPEEIAARPWSGALAKTRVAQVPEYLLSRPSLLGLKEGGAMLLKIFYGE